MHAEWLRLACQGNGMQAQLIEQGDRRIARPPGYRPSAGMISTTLGFAGLQMCGLVQQKPAQPLPGFSNTVT